MTAATKATMADPPMVLSNEEKAALEASGLQNVSIALLLQMLDFLFFANQLTTTTLFRSLTASFRFDLQQPTGINPTINSVRIGKEESIREKLIGVAAIKEQRRLEIKEHKALNAEITECTRHKVLSLCKQLNQRFAHAKIEQQKRAKADQLAKFKSEIQLRAKFTLIVHRY